MSRLRQRRSSSRHDGNDKRHAQAANVAAASTPRVSSAISDPTRVTPKQAAHAPAARYAVRLTRVRKNARTTAAQNAAYTTHVSASTATVNHETIAAPSLLPLGSSQHSASRPARPAEPVMKNFIIAASPRVVLGWMQKNTKKESLMSAARSRIARTLIGAACIGAATCAFVWFAFQFAPGEPRELTVGDESYASSIEASGNSRYVAEGIVDIPFGQTYKTDGLTWGKWFSVSEDERSSWSDEEREQRLASESYLYDSSGIEFAAQGLKTVSLEAFAEWYPHYAETTGYTEARKHACKLLLVDIAMTNTSDHAQTLPRFVLWSEDANGANDTLENGMGSDKYLFEEMYGESSDRGLVEKHLPDGWNVLEPGETRSWTVPSLIYENTFRDPAAYENIDPSRFCVALADYDPPTIYRLWLG